MKPRVAFFLSSLDGGGAERVILDLAQELRKQGYGVDILLIRKSGAYLQNVPEGISVIELRTRSKRYFRTISAIPALIEYLNTVQPLCILSSLPRNNIAMCVADFFVTASSKVILIEHSNLTEYLKRENGFKVKVLPFLMSLLYRRADHIVGVSKGVVEDIRRVLRLPTKRMTAIYNPINLAAIQQQAATDVTASPNGASFILGVGRLTKQKNFTLLIEAFSILGKDNDSLHLVLLGEGEERQKLEQQVGNLGLKNRVHMPGFVDNPFAWMKQTRMLVLSSDFEGFGNVLVEAMACGTPVVSTDCPDGPREVLEDGKWGILVPRGDSEALAQAMQKTLENPIDPEVLKERAKDFSPEKIAKHYISLMT